MVIWVSENGAVVPAILKIENIVIVFQVLNN